MRDDPNKGCEGDYIQTGGRVEKCFVVYAYNFQQSLNNILHNSHLFSSREKNSYYHRSVTVFFVGLKILTQIVHECPKQSNTFCDTDMYHFVFFEMTD